MRKIVDAPMTLLRRLSDTLKTLRAPKDHAALRHALLGRWDDIEFRKLR